VADTKTVFRHNSWSFPLHQVVNRNDCAPTCNGTTDGILTLQRTNSKNQSATRSR